MTLDVETLRSLPKVALHDHLDGGVRPATIIELAAETGHVLPASRAEALADWFFEAADSGSLERYLETFTHTVAVLQTEAALRRVAEEFVLDQAADGVVYAEARWAPAQHTSRLDAATAVAAVRDGLVAGMAAAALEGRPIIARQVLCHLRHTDGAEEIARLVVEGRADLVVGFDLAGPEAGFPASRFAEALRIVREGDAFTTIHAGEAAGVESLRDAVHACGALRLGHGARMIDEVGDDGSLSPFGEFVRHQQILLELCPSSNLQTGVAARIAEHPFGRLADLGFAVSVHCDNRTMSRTTLSREFALLGEAFGFDLDDVETFTLNAAVNAFVDVETRDALIAEVIVPGFEAARAGETDPLQRKCRPAALASDSSPPARPRAHHRWHDEGEIMKVEKPYRTGTPCWADVAVTDIAASQRFYGELFGWTFTESGEEYGGYCNALLDGDLVAGMGPIMQEGQPPAWTVYLATDDARATAEAITTNGGEVVVEPMEVAPFGTMTIATDSAGAFFGTWQPDTHPGFQRYDEPGAVCWTEVMLTDQPQALPFYSGVFGWRYDLVEGAPQAYSTFTVPEGDHEAGGIGQLPDSFPIEGVRGFWAVYFAVTNVDEAVATVERLGGTKFCEPFDTPYGRVAPVQGPSGENFSLLQPPAA